MVNKVWCRRTIPEMTGFLLGCPGDMDAAFRLGPATPAAGPGGLAPGAAAGAWHATDRQEAGGGQRMRRQLGPREDCFDLLARDIGKRIEFEPVPVGLDHRHGGAQA